MGAGPVDERVEPLERGVRRPRPRARARRGRASRRPPPARARGRSPPRGPPRRAAGPSPRRRAAPSTWASGACDLRLRCSSCPASCASATRLAASRLGDREAAGPQRARWRGTSARRQDDGVAGGAGERRGALVQRDGGDLVAPEERRRPGPHDELRVRQLARPPSTTRPQARDGARRVAGEAGGRTAGRERRRRKPRLAAAAGGAPGTGSVGSSPASEAASIAATPSRSARDGVVRSSRRAASSSWRRARRRAAAVQRDRAADPRRPPRAAPVGGRPGGVEVARGPPRRGPRVHAAPAAATRRAARSRPVRGQLRRAGERPRLRRVRRAAAGALARQRERGGDLGVGLHGRGGAVPRRGVGRAGARPARRAPRARRARRRRGRTAARASGWRHTSRPPRSASSPASSASPSAAPSRRRRPSRGRGARRAVPVRRGGEHRPRLVARRDRGEQEQLAGGGERPRAGPRRRPRAARGRAARRRAARGRRAGRARARPAARRARAGCPPRRRAAAPAPPARGPVRAARAAAASRSSGPSRHSGSPVGASSSRAASEQRDALRLEPASGEGRAPRAEAASSHWRSSTRTSAGAASARSPSTPAPSRSGSGAGPAGDARAPARAPRPAARAAPAARSSTGREQLVEAGERQLRLRLRAVRAQHPEPAGRRRGVREQRGLADPGGAGEQERAAAPVARAVEQRGDGGLLGPRPCSSMRPIVSHRADAEGVARHYDRRAAR